MSEIVVDQFDEHVGPVPDVNVDDPTSIFDNYFTPELLLNIVKETNRYAAACIESEEIEIDHQTTSSHWDKHQ